MSRLSLSGTGANRMLKAEIGRALSAWLATQVLEGLLDTETGILSHENQKTCHLHKYIPGNFPFFP